jgi:hypothetical protein
MMEHLRKYVERIPFADAALRRVGIGGFSTSADYWERRYRKGGNSGAGSYRNLAEFKARVVNDFVGRNRIQTVIEHGCGDGAQLQLAKYSRYTGVDVSSTAIELCRRAFAGDSTKQFILAQDLDDDTQAELALSLDVIYHLVEDDVFERYMYKLFRSASRFVIMYSSNMDSSWPSQHVRHREFTRWVEKNEAGWSLLSTIKNIYPYDPERENETSFADFYIFGKSEGPL